MPIREGRGRWATMQFPVASAATFKQGDLVAFDTALNIREWSSVQSVAVGIALADSVNSLPSGTVQVKVPSGPETTFWARMATNVAASALSAGLSVGITSDATNTDLIATSVSLTSRLGVLTGRYRISPISEAEVTPNRTHWAYGAVSTVTVLS